MVDMMLIHSKGKDDFLRFHYIENTLSDYSTHLSASEIILWNKSDSLKIL